MQQYDYKRGRLIGNDNVLQAQKTILESKEYCSINKYCVGFTFQASSRNPVTRVMVSFKNSQDFEQATSQNGLLQDTTAGAVASSGTSTTLGWHAFLKKSAEPHKIVHHTGEQVSDTMSKLRTYDSLPQISTHLDVTSFASFMQQHEMVAVDYYAPWCVWCRNLEPVWEQVAGDLQAKPWGDVVKLAKVDCTAPTSFELCKQAQISVYPTLCLFRNGLTSFCLQVIS
jgi:thiol-disulfide isomerase/thioredoxin